MAEFCLQCATELDFEPDFVGLTTAEDEEKGFAAKVLCESCGVTLVDAEGRCITNCAERHKPEVPGFDEDNARLGVFGLRYGFR